MMSTSPDPGRSGEVDIIEWLTGHRLKGWDCFKAGVATHAASEDSVDQIQADLVKLTSSGENVSDEDVQCLLDNFTSDEAKNHTFSLKNQMQDINSIFSANSMEAIVSLLQDEKIDASLRTKALKSIEAASPTSLKIAFRQIREGAHLSSLADVLRMEQRLVLRCCEDKDFYEGVRATLIDRDNKPKWDPPRLEEVTDDKVDYYFSNLGPLELQL